MSHSDAMREWFQDVRANSPIEIYLSANASNSIWCPCRMQPVHEAQPSYVDKCDKYIVDSSFNNPEITNQDVLDKGHSLGATGVMLEDVYQDFDGTVEALLKGRELADDHAFGGDVIYPLQAPYVSCWNEIGKPDMVAIGGLKNASDSERLAAAHSIRNAGFTGHLHGLGWGVSDTLAREIRANPNLLDSVDSRTPQTNAMEMNYWPGESVSKSMTMHTMGFLYESYRKVSIADDVIETTTLGDYT